MKRTNGVNRGQWQLRLECIQNLHLQGIKGIENQGCSIASSSSFSHRKIEHGIIRIGSPNKARDVISWLAFGSVGGGTPSGMVLKRKSASSWSLCDSELGMGCKPHESSPCCLIFFSPSLSLSLSLSLCSVWEITATFRIL